MTSQDAILKLAEVFIPANYIKILRAMDEHPMTTQEIIELTGLHPDRAYKVIFMLRQWKVICCVDYIRGTTAKFKVYGLGSKDAKFKKKTPHQRCKEYRQRKKAKEAAEVLRVWGI
jgi:hypothetical protein